jgi:hypothetical protein
VIELGWERSFGWRGFGCESGAGAPHSIWILLWLNFA